MMIPVNEPLLAGNEKKYFVHCIYSGWLSSEGGLELTDLQVGRMSDAVRWILK